MTHPRCTPLAILGETPQEPSARGNWSFVRFHVQGDLCALACRMVRAGLWFELDPLPGKGEADVYVKPEAVDHVRSIIRADWPYSEEDPRMALFLDHLSDEERYGDLEPDDDEDEEEPEEEDEEEDDEAA